MTTGTFSTYRILEANRKVEIISSIWPASGHMFAQKIVLQLPPIAFFSKLVSLDCLYGTWSLFLSQAPTTTCSKNESDLLMYEASFIKDPSAPVFLILSLPARSTKWSLEKITFSEDSTVDLLSMWIVKIAWLLEELVLTLLLAVARS